MKKLLIILLIIFIGFLFIACPPKFTLTITILGTGTVKANNIDVTSGEEMAFNVDAEVSLVVTHGTGYQFYVWGGDDGDDVTGTTNPYTIKMIANKTITATFITEGNTAPIVSNVTISGAAEVGQVLSGNYNYSDVDQDEEGESTFRWLWSATETGIYEAIADATLLYYELVADDLGRYIKFEVTPVAQTGVLTGTPVQSGAVGPVVPANTAPTVINVNISGTLQVNQIITGIYTYADADGDSEGTSMFRWLRCATVDGTYIEITGATSNTYLLSAGDENQFIKFEVIPVASGGVPSGIAVQSAGAGPILSAAALTISASPAILSEAFANDGSLDPNTVTITVNNSTFIEVQITLDNITPTGLPAGLSLANPTYIDTTHISVDIDGNALANENSNDTIFTITIDEAAITGATTGITTGNIFIDFDFFIGKTYTLTVTTLPAQAVTDGCSISYNPNTYPIFIKNQDVIMTPNDCTGWAFSMWSGANWSNVDNNGDGTYTITMNEDKVLEANYIPSVNADSFSEPFEGNGTWVGLTSGYNWSLYGTTTAMEPDIQSATVHSGTYSAQLGPIPHNMGGESFFHINMNITQPGKALSFYYLKNTGSSFHYFAIIDNTEGRALFVTNENTTGWQYVEIPLSAQAHDIWFYALNNSSTSDLVNVFVDDIAVIDGIRNIEVSYGDTPIPHNSGGLNPVDIGNVYTNIDFTLHNTGASDISISSITLVGGASEITLVTPTPSLIGPGAMETLSFLATVGGPYTSGVVTINSNDPDTPAYEFSFICTVTLPPIFVEDFKNATFPPADWTRYNVDGGGTQWVRNTTYYHTKPASARHTYSYVGNQEGWLVTPAIDLSSYSTSATLKFWRLNMGYNSYQYHGIWLSTTTNDPTVLGAFTEVQELGQGTLLWVQFEIDLSAYIGQPTIYIGFLYTGNNADTLLIDDVEVFAN